MATCQNGRPVITKSSGINYSVVPGTNVKIGIHKGMINTVMKAFFAEYNKKVENLHEGFKGNDEWGWYVRPIRGQSSGYSNHSGGYAGDLNATQHPIGTTPSHNFSSGQIKEIHALLKKYPGIRWGGDYSGRKDGMHFEWIGSNARLAATYAKVIAMKPITPPQPPKNGDGKVTINGKDYPDIGYLYPSSVNAARKSGKMARSVFRVQVWLRGLGYWPKDGKRTLNGVWDANLQAAFDKFRWDHRTALKIKEKKDAGGSVGYASLSLLRKLDGTKNYPIKKEK